MASCKTCIFAGPTQLPPVPEGCSVLPPAVAGSIFRAVTEGYTRIGIIDGYFGNVPAVWHKEILFALSKGVEVFGAASIGALRAAELARFGMRGFGAAYRLYRRGTLVDDDEVCVAHLSGRHDYHALTYAMISIRSTLRRLRRVGALTRSEEQSVCRSVKALHFSKRDDDAIRSAAAAIGRDPEWLLQQFGDAYIDVKARDAELLVRHLAGCATKSHSYGWRFPETVGWRKQFVRELSEVPQLGVDCATLFE